MCTLSVSNVIYHKFSHGAAFYTLSGKNVNVMLELGMSPVHGTFRLAFKNAEYHYYGQWVCRGYIVKIQSNTGPILQYIDPHTRPLINMDHKFTQWVG